MHLPTFFVTESLRHFFNFWDAWILLRWTDAKQDIVISAYNINSANHVFPALPCLFVTVSRRHFFNLCDALILLNYLKLDGLTDAKTQLGIHDNFQGNKEYEFGTRCDEDS